MFLVYILTALSEVAPEGLQSPENPGSSWQSGAPETQLSEEVSPALRARSARVPEQHGNATSSWGVHATLEQGAKA